MEVQTVEHVALEERTFDPADYADEIAAARENVTVGTTVWLENDNVRIWDLHLAPGERLPFHCHTTTYYWVCTAPGQGIQRFTDGTLAVWDFRVGEIDFLEASLDEPLIHDLENVGDTPIRFSTVELFT
jgi:hypothetical protein